MAAGSALEQLKYTMGAGHADDTKKCYRTTITLSVLLFSVLSLSNEINENYILILAEVLAKNVHQMLLSIPYATQSPTYLPYVRL